MDIEKLISFCAVVETGGMSEAARKLFCSQPAVSKHVAALEEELSCRLFRREGRRLVLTDSGEIVYQWGLRWQRDMRQLQRELYALQSREAHGICFGATHHIGTYLVPPALSRYKRMHPQGQVTFTVDFLPGILRLLMAEQIGFALVPQTEGLAGHRLSLVPIACDEMAAVIPQDHPLSGEEMLLGGQLLAHPLLLSKEQSAARAFVLERLKEAGIIPRETVELPDVQAVKQGILHGMGIGILSKRAVEPEVRDGALKSLPIQGVRLERALYLATRQGAALTPEDEAFIAMIQAG